MIIKSNLQLASSLANTRIVDTRTSERTQQEVQAFAEENREYCRQNLGHVVGMPRPAVERVSFGRAPTAFRIWAFGKNVCDAGDVVFSERSAKTLIDEQTSRGRLYSFDFDHRSLLQGGAPEGGRAAGWHRLEVRRDQNGNPELWAVECAWTEEARAGIESDPPVWRYFSPAYSVAPGTREVLSYTNCALTNNPLTHGIPALASATGRLAVGRLAVARLGVRALVARANRMVMASSRSLSVASAGPARLQSAIARVQALQARCEQVERASAARSTRVQSGSGLQYGDLRDPVSARIDAAIGAQRRNRGVSPAEIRKGTSPRRPPQPRAPKDPVIEMIERAARNSRGSLRK